MDPNRSENSANHQQNVHLYMHHVCNCQNTVYPTFYPTIGYRAPIMQYPAPPRPYLQHYQYTQFNLAGQYGVPVTQMASIYQNGTTVTDLFRTRTETQDPTGVEGERVPETPNFELLTDEPEEFVKFLERSCLTAEQIAYRNRNRPCFRNIQNLCIRTRSEILKPSTTISNIHSQGIPWATKDFIYAFIRLTNCWHILKGYWEIRDGSSLGKIEKELTSDFRDCYLRWEKETMQLSAQLTRVFYNLDTNLNAATVDNGVISSPSQGGLKKGDEMAPAETADQSNQTCSGDFPFKVETFDEENRRIYMKPGNYSVPKKGFNNNDVSCNTSNSPRGIEFLETAQNVNKVRDIVNDRYWSNVHIDGKNGDGEQAVESVDLDMDLTSTLTVQNWLLNSDFSEPTGCCEVPEKLNDFRSYFNATQLCEAEASEASTKSVALLQRANKTIKKPEHIEITSRTYRKRTPSIESRTKCERNGKVLELKSGGITEAGVNLMEKLLNDMKTKLMNGKIVTSDKTQCNPVNDVEMILKKIRTHSYVYLNEVVSDLRYLIKYMEFYPEPFCKIDTKSDIIDGLLNEYLPNYDFTDIQGDLNEMVGPLKLRKSPLSGISEENQ